MSRSDKRRWASTAGVLDDSRALGIGHAAPVGHLPLAQQHARSRALEADDTQVAQLAPVEGSLEDPGAPRQTRAVKEVLVPARDLEEQLALAGVPVEGARSRRGARDPLDVW